MNINEYSSIRKEIKLKRDSDTFINEIIALMPQYVKDESTFVRKRKGSILVHKSDPAIYAYITISGDISVVNEFESGKIFEPVVIPHSNFLGVVEIILDMKEIISTNLAKTDIEYIQIPKKVFLKWLDESHEATRYVLKCISSNFRNNMKESGENIILDSMYLVVSHLLKFAKYSESKKLYVLAETRENTSVRTGVNLRTLYRHIKKLKLEGYCSSQYRSIIYDENQKIRLNDYYLLLRNK